MLTFKIGKIIGKHSTEHSHKMDGETTQKLDPLLWGEQNMENREQIGSNKL